MTLAGTSEIAFVDETSFATLPGTPTWYQPGEDITIDDFTLERNLDRKRKPNDPRPQGSRAGNRLATLSLSWSLTDTNWHTMALANSGTGLGTTGSLAPTATWYLKSDTLPGVEERFVQGSAVTSFSVEYTQGEDVTVSLSIECADEIGAGDANSPTVPSSIQRPSKDDIATFAGADFTLNGTQLSTKLQSFTLECSNMSSFRRGQSQVADDVVVGPYEPSLSMEATLSGSRQRELAYGTSGATQPQDTIDSSSGTITLANPAGTLVTYNLVNLQPTTYSWSELTSPDSNTSDPTEYHLTDITTA